MRISNSVFWAVISFIFAGLSCYFWLKPPSIHIEKDVVYENKDAEAVRLVWGINGWQQPGSVLIPENSFKSDGYVYTPMFPDGQGKFKANIGLTNGNRLDYCFNYSLKTSKNVFSDWDKNKGANFFLNYTCWYCNPGYYLFLSGIFFLVFLFLRFQKNDHDLLKDHIQPALLHSGIHITMLDGLRGIAVLLVMIHHWLPENHILNLLPNGSLGVNIFFVLSGFLITRILLEKKNDVEQNKVSRLNAALKFMARRSLRIFPIYYLILIFLLIYGYQHLRENMAWYLTYMVNYLFYEKQSYMGYLSHVWSLAVEEQFYLIWPWLILFINKRMLPYLMGLFILIGISSNFIFNQHGWWAMILTPACFDAFGIGGLLAYLMVVRNDWLLGFSRIMNYLLGIAILLFLLSYVLPFNIPQRPYHSVLGIWLVGLCLKEQPIQILKTIFNNRFLRMMGKISYGIYLYHLFIPLLRIKIQHQIQFLGLDFIGDFHLPESIKNECYFMLQWLMVLIVAWISWVLIEKPFNNLKNRLT